MARRLAQAARKLELGDRTPAVTRNPEKLPRPAPCRKVKKAVMKKASFRRKKSKHNGTKQQAEQSLGSPSPWLCRSTWMGMKDQEKWKHLPLVLRKVAKPGTSFTFRQGSASVDVLVRDRAYWVRSTGDEPMPAQRNFAWRKLGGPVPAWRAAAAAVGITCG